MPRTVAAFLLFFATCAAAQELTGSYGRTRTANPSDATFAWALGYTHDVGRHFSLGLTYQNEGHVPGHHRDGFAPQAWLQLPLTQHFTVAGGIGPYRYFDTMPAANAAGYEDRNGWGILYSLAARHTLGGPWLAELRLNRTEVRDGMDSTMLLAGLGYRLERSRRDAPGGETEFGVLAGRSIVNSFESEAAAAWSAELRHRFNGVLGVSLGWLDEGAPRVVERQGVFAQAWLEPAFYDGRLTVGAGYGPYLAKDRLRTGNESFTAALASLSASYRFGPRWSGRVTASRVISRYDRDADLVLVGAGYRF